MKTTITKKQIQLFLLLLLPPLIWWLVASFIGARVAENQLQGKYPTLAIISKNPIPEFSFINQDGDSITNDSFTGKIYITNFMFTNCKTASCSRMNLHMIKLQQKLEKYNKKNGNMIMFLTHTVDPKNDTPKVLKAYKERAKKVSLGADLSNWHFVTGDKKHIYEIAKSYLCVAEEDKNSKDGGYIHSDFFVLVDNKGRIRSGFDDQGNPRAVYDGSSGSSIKALEKDISKILIPEINRSKH